jgi:hypothetical protein
MAPALPVHRPLHGTSSTKAALGMGLQRQLQSCRCATLWVQKIAVAGCLA